MRAKADALGKLLAETVDDCRPFASEPYQQLNGAASSTLNEAAAALLAWAPRCSSVKREAILYVLSGTLIEHGADAEIGWNQLLLRLQRCLLVLASHSELLTANDVDLDAGDAYHGFETNDVEVKGWVSNFPFLVVAALARLVRRPELRRQARELDDFADHVWRLEQKRPSRHGHYLSEVLDVLDDQILLVDVISHRIELVQVNAVRNGAHLFALLEGADTQGIGGSAGNSYQVQHHYASFGCLDEATTGLFRKSTHLQDVDWMFMLGVEVSGHHIPMVDVLGLGRFRVVVCAPKRLGSRSFVASDFFAPIHDALVESVVPIRVFSGPELAAITAAVLDSARSLRAALGRTNGALPYPDGLTEHPAWLAHWNPR